MTDYLQRECQDCLHWQDKGPNPEDVSSGHYGECRERPHAVAIVVPPPPRAVLSGAPGTQQLPRTQLHTLYAPLPAGFQACSHFTPRHGEDPLPPPPPAQEPAAQ
jgi:hypothetical protein